MWLQMPVNVDWHLYRCHLIASAPNDWRAARTHAGCGVGEFPGEHLLEASANSKRTTMEPRSLKPTEKSAIDGILEDAERPSGDFTPSLEALDAQCRSIWSDWGISRPAHRKTPNRKSPKASRDVAPTSSLTPQRPSRDGPVQSLPSNEEDDEEIRTKPPSRFRGWQRGQRPRKSALALNAVDPIRLAQDNVELRAQVGKLRAALDRANAENANLEARLRRAAFDTSRQKKIISYLKEEKLYGRK
jgi:hypothetical protein